MSLDSQQQRTIALNPFGVMDETLEALKDEIRAQHDDADDSLPENFAVGSVVLDSRTNSTHSHAVVTYERQSAADGGDDT